MLELRFNCICIKEFPEFDMKRGMILAGLATIYADGTTTFIVEFTDGTSLKCVQEWFADHFKIIE